MNPDLMLIFGFVLIAATLAILAGTTIHRKQIAHDERKLELEAEIERAKAEQLRYSNGDYRKMEERMRVLERIATDGNHTLASQIEELRALDRIEDDRTETVR